MSVFCSQSIHPPQGRLVGHVTWFLVLVIASFTGERDRLTIWRHSSTGNQIKRMSFHSSWDVLVVLHRYTCTETEVLINLIFGSSCTPRVTLLFVWKLSCGICNLPKSDSDLLDWLNCILLCTGPVPFRVQDPVLYSSFRWCIVWEGKQRSFFKTHIESTERKNLIKFYWNIFRSLELRRRRILFSFFYITEYLQSPYYYYY